MAKQFPLYQDIANDIEKQVKSYDFEYDVPICTEKSLCEKYKVSRITARHAITSLEEKGILNRVHGIGSFVTRPGAKGAFERSFVLIIPIRQTQGGILQVVEAANQIIFDRGHHFSIHINEPNTAKNVKLLENLFNRQIDGIAYYAQDANLPMEILNAFVKRNKPLQTL